MTEQYERTIWVNGETPLNKTNMDHIEIGISNNSADISVLKGDMKFKGVVNALPTEDVEIGNVYQAGASGLCDLNKIGDLLVCTEVNPLTWHVIPSGDETSGTVTSVSAGAGLTGGTITGSGTLSLDANYTANANRNGLLSSNYFQKLDEIDYELAVNRDYERLQNVPEQLRLLQIEQTMGNSENWVMSQQATTAALNTKSNIGHNHALTDINNGTSSLDNLLNGKAPSNHTHGIIDIDGRLVDNTGFRTNCFLKSSGIDGKLLPITKIESSDINGTTIGNVNLTELKTALYDETTQQVIAKAAKEDHTHVVFDDSTNGFTPQAPATNPERYLLAGNGSWVPSVDVQPIDTVIDLIYPVGAYFETSSPTFNPTKEQWFETTTNTYVDTDGENRVYAHAKWPGVWVLENEGLFHISGSSAGTYKCLATSGANKADTGGVAGRGVLDGGEVKHLLTDAESGQKGGTYTTTSNGSHSHTFSAIQRDTSKTTLKSGDKGYPTASKSTAAAGEHTHSVSIGASNATQAHNNMPPYICIYRWHRTAYR